MKCLPTLSVFAFPFAVMLVGCSADEGAAELSQSQDQRQTVAGSEAVPEFVECHEDPNAVDPRPSVHESAYIWKSEVEGKFTLRFLRTFGGTSQVQDVTLSRKETSGAVVYESELGNPAELSVTTSDGHPVSSGGTTFVGHASSLIPPFPFDPLGPIAMVCRGPGIDPSP